MSTQNHTPPSSWDGESAILARIAITGTAIALTVTAATILPLMIGEGTTPQAPVPPNLSDELNVTAEALSKPVSVSAPAPTLASPLWIWTARDVADHEDVYLRKTVSFDAIPERVVLRYSCDNEATVHVNGDEVSHSKQWERPDEVDLSELWVEGDNEIRVTAKNHGGPAGWLALLDVTFDDGRRDRVVSDETWEMADEPTFASVETPVKVGAYGDGPWGLLPGLLEEDIDRQLWAPKGFEVELVYSVPKSRGSWVSLTEDGQGRLIASDQGEGLYRITPCTPEEGPDHTVVERIDVEIKGAQGLLVLDGDLYVVVNHNDDSGLYLVTDENGDDEYDTVEPLRALDGNGEHGPHAIIEGPDKFLYVICGNMTELPEPEKSRVPRGWDEDHLLPRLWDAKGHAKDIMAPGGWIARTDRRGETWEVFCIGFRNPYDLAFHRDGELFTYDADMEWDMGAPWYRPTRVVHAVSGADYGWRAGSGKWPSHYPDSLPGALDIGPGSPTGMAFGYGTRFPVDYREALFILDWTFGTIFAVHLDSDGATYGGRRETFVTGRPLPLSDLVVNPADGALYFTVGGRNVTSALYRVRWVGEEHVDVGRTPSVADLKAREKRAALERYHDPETVDRVVLSSVWDALGDEDRFVRHAARVVLEHRAVQDWIGDVVGLQDPKAILQAVIALCHLEDKEHRDLVVEKLKALSPKDLPREQALSWLRCLALSFIRLGLPEGDDERREWQSILTDWYPSTDQLIDRELVDLLVALDSTAVVARTIPLMEEDDRIEGVEIDPGLLSRNDSYGKVILKMASALPQRQQVHYALSLRNATSGWTPLLRKRYFDWFASARQTSGGNSFGGFLDRIRKDALEKVPEGERAQYEADDDPAVVGDRPVPVGPGKAWTLESLVDETRGGLAHRNFDNGRRMYLAARCDQCHRFAGRGLPGGPDLSAVSTRFTMRDLIESMVEPSRTISDQYVQTELILEGGEMALGRIVEEDETHVKLVSNLLEPDVLREVAKERILERNPSKVSAMMPALLNDLSKEEVLDLLAYLLAEGDARSSVFTQPDDDGFTSLFNGKTLDGWTGDPELWTVEDGVIVGRTEKDAPIADNTFLIWAGGPLKDFELELEVQIKGDNNSGVQYRSKRVRKYGVQGYQCDLHPNPPYHGMLYEEGGRGILATRGHHLQIGAGGERGEEKKFPVPDTVDITAWNKVRIVAEGNRLEHRVNGETTVVIEDEEIGKRSEEGILALQLHKGGAYEVRFRNVRLKKK